MRGGDELKVKEKEGRKQINRKHTKAEIIKGREYNFSLIPEQMAVSGQTKNGSGSILCLYSSFSFYLSPQTFMSLTFHFMLYALGVHYAPHVLSPLYFWSNLYVKEK